MGLRVGQRISIRDLLYGLILRSGNDAAHTLAIDAAGSTQRFVAQMNRYAAALGLSDTHYANPVGLDQKGNYSSALDLATLTRHLLRSRPSPRSPTREAPSSAASTQAPDQDDQRAALDGALGHRRQDRTHLRQPSTCWSAPAARRGST